jgi:hypothetical protein
MRGTSLMTTHRYAERHPSRPTVKPHPSLTNYVISTRFDTKCQLGNRPDRLRCLPPTILVDTSRPRRIKPAGTASPQYAW